MHAQTELFPALSGGASSCRQVTVQVSIQALSRLEGGFSLGGVDPRRGTQSATASTGSFETPRSTTAVRAASRSRRAATSSPEVASIA